MANQFLTISMITREALRVLVNNLTFTKLVSRKYDDKFAIEGAKIGATLNVRKPPRYTVSSGTNLVIQDITETQVPVVLNQQRHVGMTFSSADLLLSIDDFSKRIIKPAVAALANQIDFDGLQLYKTVANAVGTPGTVPNALLTYLDAGVKLDNNATPIDGDRSVVVNPRMQATIVDALKGLFQSANQIKQQYEKGEMGTTAGFNWYMDQNVAVHQVGPLGGAPLVNGAAQVGSSLVVDGFTAAAALRLRRGDTFTMPLVFGVNPQSRQSTGELLQFVVTADVSSDAAGNATIPIDPPIITSGPTQTVTVSPADNAALTISGTANQLTPQGLAFHRDAFTLVTADLPLPEGVDKAARVSDPQTGLSMRLVRAYDINTDLWPCRVEVLYGWAALYPQLACRIQS